jgi:hypothetical protein
MQDVLGRSLYAVKRLCTVHSGPGRPMAVGHHGAEWLQGKMGLIWQCPAPGPVKLWQWPLGRVLVGEQQDKVRPLGLTPGTQRGGPAGLR